MDILDQKNFNLLNTILNDNQTVIDVGANMGQYTDFFLNKLKSTGKIYSIELFPDTCNSLKQKYVNNNNVKVLNYAISDVDGKLPFYSGNHHCLHNILGHDVNFRDTKLSGEIESMRIDSLFANEEKIDLIKIDVEGAELLVLEGCKNIINKIEYILVECHLKKDWDNIKKLLLDDYNLECFNSSADVNGIVKINNKSEIAYQCFCKKKIQN